MLATHCIIQRERLSAKQCRRNLYKVLNDGVHIVNEIVSRALNSTLFTALCESVGFQYQHLFFHAEVRWVSRGRVLSRLF